MPVPLRVILCGLPGSLSLIDNEAVRVPAAVGLNVTLMVQLPPPASEAPQVLIWLKSAGFERPVSCESRGRA